MKILFVILSFLLFLGSVNGQDSPFNIRLIAFKHSKESMADGDANLAIRAAQKAAEKGLHIKVSGNFYFDKDGEVKWDVWEYGYDLDRLRQFFSEKMKIDASPGDTVIVFTIGHGFTGGLQNLGPRPDVMKAIVQAAEENKQRTLWWQLSCHAAAGLLPITSLTPNQQKLFSMSASSTANELSAAGVQGRVMEKVFLAIADGSLDTNKDGIITAKEFRVYLDTIGQRGALFFAANDDTAVFGGRLRILLPVIDRNNPQGRYNDNYIPWPGG